MVWTPPLTAIAGSVLTAAEWNVSVRDNLNETAPALATQESTIFVGTGVNSIAERLPAEEAIVTQETTTSTSPADLATVGPTVTVTTGPNAIIYFRAGISNSTAGATAIAGYDTSGATTLAANIARAISSDGLAANSRMRMGTTVFTDELTAGSNIFKMQYWVSGGTGTFIHRQISVLPL
jgi:hypothetical protein